jgi:hypothetical protein
MYDVMDQPTVMSHQVGTEHQRAIGGCGQGLIGMPCLLRFEDEGCGWSGGRDPQTQQRT